MNQLTIVYASDEKFQCQTYVSMYSILSCRNEVYYISFKIMIPMGDSSKFRLPEWDFDNYEIELIEVDGSCFDSINMKIDHITKPTYYRLLIPNYIKAERCIYLDGDTICASDIIDLYREDLEGCIVGGCRGELLGWSEASSARLAHNISVDSGEDYINAGVLLIDVNSMREYVGSMLSDSAKSYPMQDQDVINHCLYGKIKVMHPRYNLYSWTKNMFDSEMVFRYSKELMEEAIDRPCIIHYANRYTKPWINDVCILGELWWKVAKDALAKDQLDCIMESLNKEKDLEIQYEKKLTDASRIVLYGYGKQGISFLDFAKKSGIYEKIDLIIDNDPQKQGTYVDEIEIVNFDSVEIADANTLIVVSSQRYASEICSQLNKKGIDESSILVYKHGIAYHISSNNYCT